MDAEWVIVTLQDALATLEETLAEIEADPDAVAELLQEHMPAVFAKLNYAWNTREAGPAAIETMDHDVLVGWPEDVPGL